MCSETYKVTVFTGDERNAGTGHDVFINLFGDANLQCGEIQLPDNAGNDFMPGG